MKQVYPLLGWFLAILLLPASGSSGSAALRAQCTLVCQGQVNVGLGASCAAVIEYTDILTNPNACTPGGAGNYLVTVMNAGNTAVLPGSPVVTGAQIGQTLPVKVTHVPSGNTCWSFVEIQDEQAPQLVCPADVTVACTDSTEPIATGMATASDCSGNDLVFFDNVTDNGCGDPIRTVARTFIATDPLGNTATCTQLINVASPENTPVVFPPDLDGFANPALACGPNVNTDPVATGRPTLAGQPIENGMGCPLVTNFTDQVVPICGGTYKIFRNWTVVRWCTGTVETGLQVIKVADTTPPVLACPAALTIGTSSGQVCTGSTVLPPAQVSDDCSGPVSVSIITPVGILNTNGGAIAGLSLGTHTVLYRAQDACGNLTTCPVTVEVIDDDVPVVVCDEITTVTVNASGIAEVAAAVFDDGSYDNCCPVTFDVRRMDAGCGTGTAFGPTVRLCCADIGQSVQVEMRATDCFGNSNSCMVTVNVDDKTDPVIACPADVTILCTQDPDDPALTGTATATDGCGATTPTVTETTSLNMCGLGTITRTFTATDAFGNSDQCSQVITIIDSTPFSIDWPADFTLDACVGLEAAEPDSLPAGFDRPVFPDADCELLAISRDDQVLTVAAPACRKIVRTWSVINWCTFQANNSGAGVFTYQQTIKIIDDDAPTFACPADLDLTTATGSCGVTVTLPAVTDIEDCSDDVQVAIMSDLGVGFGPFPDVAPGTYSATYTIFDGCGNSDACTISISVSDQTPPTPYCNDGLIIDLDENLAAAVWARDFDLGSADACGGPVQLSFSTNPLDTGRLLGCADLGTQPIDLFVTDDAGNTAFCTTTLTVQDNLNPCVPPVPQVAQLGGMIQNDRGMAVANVTVALSGSNGGTVMTDNAGQYVLPDLPLGDDYTVSPSKPTDPLNGVSTYDIVVLGRHILQVEPLTNPYRIIAADANNSGTLTALDMAEIRKAILYINNGFPSNQSWRFVDGSYTFLDPTNPLDEPWPEVRNVNNFAGDLSTVNFVAVKIGDVNGNAVPDQAAVSTMEARHDQPVTLRLPDVPYRAGDAVSVPVYGPASVRLQALQFGLQFDPAQLSLLEVAPAALAVRPFHLNTQRSAAGVLTFAYDAETAYPVSANDPLFVLRFTARTAGTTAALSLTERYTPSRFFAADDATGRPLRLAFATPTAGADGVALAPNPFHTTTSLAFDLPTAGPVLLEVFDWSGRSVWVRRQSLSAGRHRWPVSAATLPSPGSYVYRLHYAGQTTSGNMVLVD